MEERCLGGEMNDQGIDKVRGREGGPQGTYNLTGKLGSQVLLQD